MSTKAKPKEKGKKFLERLAGRPALGQPPTPRPIPEEHPARSLFRNDPNEKEPPKAAAGPSASSAPIILVEETIPTAPEAGSFITTETLPIEALAIPPMVIHSEESSFDRFFGKWNDALRLHKGEIKVLRVLFANTHDIGRSEFQTTQTYLSESAKLKKRQCQNVVASLIGRGLIDKIDLQNKSNQRGLLIRVHLNPLPR